MSRESQQQEEREQRYLDNMNPSARARLLKPISRGVLRMTNHLESESKYFEDGVEANISNNSDVSRGYQDEKIRRFFDEAFADRFQWYVPIALIIVSSLLLNQFSIVSLDIDPQVYGLVLDILGASILAIGFIRDINGIKRDTQMHVGFYGSVYDPDSLTSVAQDTADGIFGTVSLISGFLLQIVALL